MLIKPGYAGDAIDLPLGSIIADVGSGHNPLPQAMYCIERDMNESADRGGRASKRPTSARLIIADAEKHIPLPDKECDFVHASHILEHTANPHALCREMSRIGAAGYIETPCPIVEYLHGRDVHNWYCFKDKTGGMILMKKNRVSKEPRFPHITDILEYNLFFPTRHRWEGKAYCRVTDSLLDILANADLLSMLKPRIVVGSPVDTMLVKIFGDYQFLRWKDNRS